MFLKVAQLCIQAVAYPDVIGLMRFAGHDEQVKLLIGLDQGIDHPHRVPEGDRIVTRPVYQQELSLDEP